MTDKALSISIGPDSRELFYLTTASEVVVAPDATSIEIATAFCEHLIQQANKPQQSAIAHVIARWEDGPLMAKLLPLPGEAIAKVQRTEAGLSLLLLVRVADKCLSLSLPVVVGPPVGDPERPTSWGLVKLGLGVWTIAPSILAQGVVVQKEPDSPPADYHAYVTVTGVPEGVLRDEVGLTDEERERLLAFHEAVR